jgi:hypothetical protein
MAGLKLDSAGYGGLTRRDTIDERSVRPELGHPMKCWHCENEARAVCVFCGRGLCAAHRKSQRHFAGYGVKSQHALSPFAPAAEHLFGASESATCVNDASWCGLCQVENVKTY